MHAKQKLLIQLLMQNTHPLSGQFLADTLEVSKRTIINYVKAINQEASFPVITSSPDGYSIDKSSAPRLLSEQSEKSEIPQNYKERVFRIVKMILIDQKSALNVYDLCDEFCISYSLLKNDIQKMNLSFAFLNIRFITRNNMLQIQGTEQDKRKLMNHMILEEQNKSFANAEALKAYFPVPLVDTLLQILNETHNQFHFYLNDFMRSNLLLHLVVMVNRLLSGNSLSKQQAASATYAPNGNSPDGQLAEEICKRIEQAFSITLDLDERIQIHFLIRSNSTYQGCPDFETLKNYMGSDLIDMLRDIITKTEDKFSLYLGSDSFLLSFCLHIKNMILRNASERQAENPIKDDLRHSSPFLYDVALYLVSLLEQRHILKFPVSEDEISFIALHLAAEIEQQTQVEGLIHCLVLTPDYLNLQEQLCQKLMNHFSSQICLLTGSVSDPKIFDTPFDFCITTLSDHLPTDKEVLHVSPFLTQQDLIHLNHAIDHAQILRTWHYLKQHFRYFFTDSNFLSNCKDLTSKKDVISRLCCLLTEHSFVPEDFEESVLMREKAASTAFSNFAIPHAFTNNAYRNTIGVYISKEGIPWEHTLVHVVFLMAISPDTLISFQTFYNSLAFLLTSTPVIEALKNCTDFDSFQNTLLNPVYLSSID